MALEEIYVFKVGGNVIEDTTKLHDFLNSFAQLSARKVLIHGGGKVATKMAAEMGVEAQMIEGRRITDAAMLDIVTMAYGGKVNKNITAKLLSLNQKAVGISGFDGGLLLSTKRPIKNGIDYGFVGDISEANSALIKVLTDASFIPVIAPLTMDSAGQILNTNADTIASAVATILSETYTVRLVYVFELAGVMGDLNDETTLIKHISQANYSNLKEAGVIKDGMIPKLDNSFQAIEKGVAEVSIIHYSKINELNNRTFDGYTRIQ
ncbi:MAG: acetylglutamate kinase [Cyclobacteriaceae bacterium]